MAKKLGVGFQLVDLVPENRESSIEQSFGTHIKQTERRKFQRSTWEDIIHFISKNNNCNSADKDLVLQYLNNKTIGYDGEGRLKKAFFI